MTNPVEDPKHASDKPATPVLTETLPRPTEPRLEEVPGSEKSSDALRG